MTEKPFNYDNYKKIGTKGIKTLGQYNIHISKDSRPIQPKIYYNPTNQIMSPEVNHRLENKNLNNNNQLAYQYKDLKQKQITREQKIPSNNPRPSSYLGKHKNLPNTYDHPNIKSKYVSINKKSSIEAKNRQPEDKNTPIKQIIDMKIRNPGTLPDKKPLNNYVKKEGIGGLSKETKTKEINPKMPGKRGFSSSNQRTIKQSQEQNESQVNNFNIETPSKNNPEKEPTNSIKNESSNKIESSSKKGRTNNNFRPKNGFPKNVITKKGLKLEFQKVIKAEEKTVGASVMDGFRGRKDINMFNKPNTSQQALNQNEFLNNHPIISQQDKEKIDVNIKDIIKSSENEIKNLRNENSRLKNQLENLRSEKSKNQLEKKFENEKLKKQLETQQKNFESEKSFLNEQISKLNKQLEEKIEELQEKDIEIERFKENIEKLEKINKEDNEKMELTKKLQMQEKIISKNDSEIYELKSKLSEALILNEKLKLEKEKMKKNNINNEDLKKGITKKENEIEIKFNSLKKREERIKNKENEINERILFIEDTERALESQRKKLDSEKKNMTDNYQSLQKEIGNLNKQKMQLENQIQAMNQQIKSFNPNSFNNNNNINSNFMNINMNNNMNNMNMKNSMNSNMNVKNSMNSNINSVNTNAVLSNMNPNNMIYNMNYNLMNNMNMMGNNMMQNMNMNSNMSSNNNMNMNNINNKINIINNSINKNTQINNNNNKKKQKAPKPLSFYEKPTLIGLQNIGATCFMNATLQCLSQTEDLTNYFLDEKRSGQKIKDNNIAVKNRNDLQLTPVYLELVKKLWDKNNFKGYFEPKRFMKTVEEMNPLFKLGQAGDSKDFIIFVLEQFHNELKKVVNNDNINDSVNVNQYIQEEAFKFFIEDFMKQTSIISDIFYGILETNNVCLYCKNKYLSQGKPYPICYNYQVFNCLIFPLEEVRKMKNGNNMMNNMIMSQNNAVTLEECFIYNQKTDFFTGENKNHCNICKQLWDSLYTSKIYSAPIVLVLILNRGKNNVFNVKLNFTEIIDITQFVSAKIEKMIYKLVGVITHYGESGPNAHFLAFCRSPINDKWYRYNDAVVTDVKNFQKDVIDFGTPYILFYKKTN